MKTKYFLFAAAAAVLAACSNDESDNWNGEIRLSSSLTVQQTNTRAATGIQGDAFDAGEQIDVYIAEDTTGTATTTYAQPLAYTTGASGVMNPSVQPYYPTSGRGVDIYALYPSGTGSSFTVKADQSDSTDYKASDLMYASRKSVARTKDNVKLTFSHLLSKVTVKLVPGNGTPDLTGAKVELLGVLPTVGLTTSIDGCSLGALSGPAVDVTVMTTTADSKEGSAVVVPQNLAQTFIKVTLATGGELYGELNDVQAGPTLVAGNEYIYTITVNLTNLNVSSEIIKWNAEGNAAEGTANMIDVE